MITSKQPPAWVHRTDLNSIITYPRPDNIRETDSSNKHVLDSISIIIENPTITRFRNKLPYFSKEIPILMMKKKLPNTHTLTEVNLGTLEKKRSPSPRSENVSTQNLLASRWSENHWEMTVEHELQTQTNQILMKEYDSRKCWSLVAQLCCSCRISLISHPLPLISLCFSVLLCVGCI